MTTTTSVVITAVVLVVVVVVLLAIGYYYLQFLIYRDICRSGKLTVKKDTYKFYDCSEHKTIRCKYGIFLRGDKHECINETCRNKIIISETIGSYRVPSKIVTCMPGTNDPIEKSCEILIDTIPIDDISILANSNVLVPVVPRFPEVQIPTTQIDTDTGDCIEFVANDIVRMVTHNSNLPVVPLNIRTKKIEYSNLIGGVDEFFFTDYTEIRYYPSNRISAVDPAKYANFTASASIQHLEYQDNVNVIRGDADGVTYLISVQVPAFRGRNRLNFCSADVPDVPLERCPDGYFWSSYSLQYEFPYLAQSYQAKSFLGMVEFSEKSFTFVYRITQSQTTGAYTLDTLTLFGFCTFTISLNDGVQLDANGHIVIDSYPPYEQMVSMLNCSCSEIYDDEDVDCESRTIDCYNTTAVVTNIYDNTYNYKHVPIFWPYIKIINMIFPVIQLKDYNLTIQDLFDIPEQYIYKLPPAPSS